MRLAPPTELGAVPALRPVASSMARRNATGSLLALCASSSTKLSTAQKVQAGATERNCPDGVAACARSFSIARTWWFGMVYQLSAPLTEKESSLPFLSVLSERKASMPHRFGGQRGRHHGVGLEPAAEAAAEIDLVDQHLLRLGADRGGHQRTGPRLELRAGIDVPGAVALEGDAVHRLQRRVDRERRHILRLELGRGPGQRLAGIADIPEGKPLGGIGGELLRMLQNAVAADAGIGTEIPFDLEGIRRGHGGGVTVGNRHDIVGGRPRRIR